jgi:hypothetical protein
MKIGLTINLQTRVNTHQTNWGEMSDKSVYFELPTKEDMVEVESIIKRLLRHHRDDCKSIPNRDGYTEFFPIKYYDYIIKYLSNQYLSLTTNDTLELTCTALKPLEQNVADDTKLLELGNIVKFLRLQRDITQAELSKQSGISLNSIKRLESGKNATIDSLVAILDFLGHTNWLETLNNQVEKCNLYVGSKSELRKRAYVPRNLQ